MLGLEEPVTTVSAACDDAPITLAAASTWLREHAFTTNIPGRVGVEVEYLTRSRDGRLPSAGELAALDRSELASGGVLTQEPGGQLEVSSRTCSGLADAITSVAQDVDELGERAADAGLCLIGEGSDAVHRPRRLSQHPRYAAMESYLDQYGPNGRRMMCATASLQITVESGAGDDVTHRWQLLHSIGPALIAAFANSPFVEGRDTGWASARQSIWWSLDPRRTRPVAATRAPSSPVDAYVQYAMDAPVLLVQCAEGSWAVDRRYPFWQWVAGRTPLPTPTIADLEYHATTLFPPVRPRGAVEVRYLDAQRGAGWMLPLVVVTTLLEDRAAADEALAASAPVDGRWVDAARGGLADPPIARAASGVLAAARAAVRRAGEPNWVCDRLDAFAEEYTDRGRAPADDLREVGPGRPPKVNQVFDAPIPSPQVATR